VKKSYILPIGASEMGEFRKNADELRKGTKTVEVEIVTRLGNFVRFVFKDKK